MVTLLQKHPFSTVLLCSASLIIPTLAYSFDLTADASRTVSDPSYLPLKGQIYGATGYEYENTRENRSSILNPAYDFSQSIQGFSQLAEYGLTDDITLRASDNYIFRDKQDYGYDGGVTNSYRFQGLDDPSFGITWRALDEKAYPLNVDFIVSYSPDLEGNRYATSVSSGTVGRGGDALDLGMALSYKTRSFTVQAQGEATALGSTSFYAPNTTATGSSSSYWSYTGELNTQTRLNDLISFNAGYSFNTSTSENFVSLGGLGYTVSHGNVNDLNAALNFQIIPNRLVASVSYDYLIFGTTHDNYGDPILSTTIKNENENEVGATLRYVFF